MMSRASRMLKWPVAATVLLAAAPTAYAEPVAASPRPLASHDPAWHGGNVRWNVAGTMYEAKPAGGASLVRR
jgi:hypothetical protein